MKFTKQELENIVKLADSLGSSTKRDLEIEIKDLLTDNNITVRSFKWNGNTVEIDTSDNSKAYKIINKEYYYNDVDFKNNHVFIEMN